MENKILYFVGGVIVGAVAGVFGTRTYFKNTYKNYADEEILSVKRSERDRFNKKLDELEKNPVKVDDTAEEKEVVDRRKDIIKTDYTSSYEKKPFDEVDDNILDPGGPEEDDPDDTDDVRNFELREHLSKNRGIEVIDESQFGEFKHYDYRDLLYYDDGIITDDEEEIVANPGALIDMDAVKEWADKDESDVLYIRNYAISCDYAINRQGFVYGGDDE